MSNDADLSFSDEEVITLYRFGIIDKNREQLKRIYGYADRHLCAWFPKLPSHVAFVQRVNRVAEVFAPLVEHIQREAGECQPGGVWLTDSFPLALVKQGQRFGAYAAKELADVGYCSTKKLSFYGLRVHV